MLYCIQVDNAILPPALVPGILHTVTDVKKTVLAIIISLLLAVFVTSGYAVVPTAEFSLSVETGAKGETVCLFLSCDVNPGISGAALNIEFDPERLEYVSFERENGFDCDLLSVTESNGRLRITFADKRYDYTGTGRILAISFRIKPGDYSGALTEVTLLAPAGSVASSGYKSIDCKVRSGGVYVEGVGLAVADGSGLVIDEENGYITGVPPMMTCDEFISNFIGSPSAEGVTGKYVGTGVTVSAYPGGRSYTVIVRFDVNGDGVLASVDCLLLKRHMLLGTELSAAALYAGDADGNGKISATDYLIAKRSLLGMS